MSGGTLTRLQRARYWAEVSATSKQSAASVHKNVHLHCPPRNLGPHCTSETWRCTFLQTKSRCQHGFCMQVNYGRGLGLFNFYCLLLLLITLITYPILTQSLLLLSQSLHKGKTSGTWSAAESVATPVLQGAGFGGFTRPGLTPLSVTRVPPKVWVYCYGPNPGLGHIGT